MDEARAVKISKFLSKYLRHAPEEIGLTLEEGGWVKVDHLLVACKKAQFHFSLADLQEVVATNSKQRFSFDETNTKIRANQGHSVAVDLALTAQEPPYPLYHGTATRNLNAIMEQGLLKMKRHHVHLSRDVDTALAVGKRYGKPVILIVDTKAMLNDGFLFFCSANGVWLVDSVPPKYLTVMTNKQ